MALNKFAYAWGKPLARGKIRQRNEDFYVEEYLTIDLEGAGEHLWVWLEKDGANTDWVAEQLAKCAQIPRRDVSRSGLKDRHAVTRQMFSLRIPGLETPNWENWDIEGVRIITATRHRKKLRIGAHRGNKFQIVVREIEGDVDDLKDRLKRFKNQPIPNYFTEQRFGFDQKNLKVFERLIHDSRSIRNRQQRSMAISAARSFLFNQILSYRIEQQNWQQGLSGEVYQLQKNGALFGPESEFNDALKSRIEQKEIQPTSTLPGENGKQVEMQVLDLENQVLKEWNDWVVGLKKMRVEADRRSNGVFARNFEYRLRDNELKLSFELTKGSYATAVLRELVCV